MEVLVEFDYEAQNVDELTIKKGDRLRNVIRKEEGWYEGEFVSTGKRGLFPDNFVKVSCLASSITTWLHVEKQEITRFCLQCSRRSNNSRHRAS